MIQLNQIHLSSQTPSHIEFNLLNCLAPASLKLELLVLKKKSMSIVQVDV